MIRLFILAGTALTVVASYLTVYQTTEYQAAPMESQLVKFQSEGLSPDPNAVTENEEVEHEIFEVPAEDARQLEMAMAQGGMAMGGMNMGGMNMDDANTPKMKLNPDGTMMSNPDGSMVMEGDEQPAMNMAQDAAPKMKLNPDGTMMTNPDGSMVMEGDEKTAMNMATEKEPDHGEAEETAAAPHGEAADAEPEHGAGPSDAGLKITEDGAFDREIELTMAEWGYSDLNIEVKSGERIRFNVKNEGQIPHEFMFMTMPAMMAVNYRATRADWSLLEHEALYEKSLVLPGGTFSFVVTVEKSGAWMFMCMLPYHMQMGMMGQVATPGMAMEMRM